MCSNVCVKVCYSTRSMSRPESSIVVFCCSLFFLSAPFLSLLLRFSLSLCGWVCHIDRYVNKLIGCVTVVYREGVCYYGA